MTHDRRGFFGRIAGGMAALVAGKDSGSSVGQSWPMARIVGHPLGSGHVQSWQPLSVYPDGDTISVGKTDGYGASFRIVDAGESRRCLLTSPGYIYPPELFDWV